MKVIKSITFNATITIGLEIGYSKKPYNKEYLIEQLQAYQKKRIDEANIYLSASVSECNIILSGQNEPHLKLDLINYPKFPIKLEIFKKEIIESMAKRNKGTMSKAAKSMNIAPAHITRFLQVNKSKSFYSGRLQ